MMQQIESTTAFYVCASRSTGKERDAESGLDNFGARMYASTMGRWMSPYPSNLGVDIYCLKLGIVITMRSITLLNLLIRMGFGQP